MEAGQSVLVKMIAVVLERSVVMMDVVPVAEHVLSRLQMSVEMMEELR